MIAPTVARSLHYHPHSDEGYGRSTLAAILAGVNSDGTINLGVFTRTGGLFSRTNVTLVQEGDTAPQDRGFAAWMPYQVGQAQKTDAVEKEASDARFATIDKQLAEIRERLPVAPVLLNMNVPPADQANPAPAAETNAPAPDAQTA